jgi:hypothetical protein
VRVCVVVCGGLGWRKEAGLETVGTFYATTEFGNRASVGSFVRGTPK